MTSYRVIRVTLIDFLQGKPETTRTAIWEGTDLDGLSTKYPPSKVFGADPLGRNEIEDGCIRTSHEFEKKVDAGDWEKIPDPRTRKNKRLTPLEQAIDEENRRDFPGDYYEPDDEDDDNHSCDLCVPAEIDE